MQNKIHAYHYRSNKTYIILLVSLALLFFTSSNIFSQPSQLASNYFEKGLKEKKDGNHKEALNIWEQARNKLKEPDFRIAQAYIQLVTENGLKNYYQNASSIYYWGLSGQITSDEQEYLIQEINYLRPLIGFKDFKNLKNKIEEKNPVVFNEIKNFWEELNPTPLNEYNERLLEHWERITFALKNYGKRSSNELDDRGQTYLQYGEPSYKKSGQLSYRQSLVHRLVQEGIQIPSFGTAEDQAIVSAQRHKLESKVRQLHSYPNYEVWIYENLTEDNQNTIFLFGNQGGGKIYRKIQTVDDFIPNSAYRYDNHSSYSAIKSSGGRSSTGGGNSDVEFDASRQSSRNNAGNTSINPAIILQLMYYQEFAALDRYFGESYDEMMDRYIDKSNSENSNMANLAREFGTMYSNKLVQIQASAPDEKSSNERKILSIPTEIYSYRFLDENNTPYLKLYSIADFEEALYYDLLKETNSLETTNENKYTLISGYQIKDENNNLIDQYAKQENISTSVTEKKLAFNIPYLEDNHSIIHSHELHKTDQLKDTSISENTTYANSLKGLNNKYIEPSEPLNTEEFTLSDFIVGYTNPEDEPSSISSQDSIHFTIAHDKTIPEETDLNIYFELYNIPTPKDSTASNVTFNYKIRKESRFLGIFKRSSGDDTGVTVNEEINNDRFSNTISIKTSTLKEGEYKLDMQVEVPELNQEISRVLTFYVQ